MYEVFSPFLASTTWQYRPARDRERFYRALDEVVYNQAFSPEAMVVYIGIKIGAARYDTDFSDAIRRCKSDAQAVRDYLEITGRIQMMETGG